jgi:hypothetical protein
MIDTDALLAPARMAQTEDEGLKQVVNANTEAFKQVRIALDTCNNVDKVLAIIADVEKAMQDLSMVSQKVEAALRAAGDPANPDVYGQYPINQPLNPDNPVAWPPGYAPDGSMLAHPEGSSEPSPPPKGSKK